jgi:uncharacterized membrane protein
MDDILSLLQDFDVANFLPAPDKFLNSLEGWVRLLILAGPLVMLALGAWYYFAPPKEANHAAGFRTYYSMGSVKAWLFAQKLAGMAYMALGGVLTVLMLIVSLFFNGEKAMAMITAALICVILEVILVAAVWVVLNILIMKAYDKDGNPRKRK